MKTAVILLLLLAGCASPVEQSFRECLMFGRSPSYVVAGATAKLECR